jgi:hypothetical protein
MIVRVTKDDLDSSSYMSSYDCAIAKAVKRLLPGELVVVGGSIYVGSEREKYAIPLRVQRELEEVMVRKTKNARSFWFNARRA